MPTDLPATSGLLADLYELTMAAGYIETGFDARATFEIFVRDLPAPRNFLVAAGLQQALEFLGTVRFQSEQIAYLRAHPAFRHIGSAFFDYLAKFRFSGDVLAMAEGTVCFADEPLLRVTAPIAEAQIVETALLAIVSFQTMVASKAARIMEAAQGRPVVEFGARRSHGVESGVLAARAAYIGGCLGTSNLEAGYRFGIPTYGTQAHSWIMAHETEEQAFTHFMNVFPEHSVLLLDTYDVRRAAEKVIALGRKPRGVRVDSGDVIADSIWLRQRLDEIGWSDVEIFASGDLDEGRIASLLASGACIDTFGVGTAVATSWDAPSLGMLYKLVELERDGEVHGAAKLSAAKVTFPGRKQVFRSSDAQGCYSGDVIALENETDTGGGKPLLEPVMRAGRALASAEPLAAVRRRCVTQVECLPAALHALTPARERYPVRHSKGLKDMLKQVQARVARASANG